ncbi:GNAT family N-acetyltransferase [Rossellomorea aquimaris]|uniref:GNAT family N-acetyltransferase n=1 Tax=Rossellomorea aquimaris TaxID=189382 RepID=UPI0007D065A8|nr:GNAT family N-acetyltransferase [Rossellomorea aquimaris]
MNNVIQAQINDLDQIMDIDHDIVCDNRRKEYITNAIKDELCLVVKEGNLIVGFLLYHTYFFDCAFISLIIVSPTKRRKGYASTLLNHFVSISPTKKIFSSTNQSNEPMKEVFNVNGFVKSGVVENLDEGDPEIVYFKSK